MTRLLLAVAVAVALPGCRDEGGAVPAVLVRDSAGTRIVENRGDPGRVRLAWRLSPTAAVDVGGDVDGKLFRAMSATRLGDGRIVVGNSGSGTIEIFGPDGKHVQSVGRAGDGPGEFRALFWVGRAAGDSILAWDSGAGRLSIFDPNGRLAATVVPRQPLGLFPQAAGSLANGRVLLALRAGPVTAGTGTTVRRDSVSYVTLGRSGDAEPVVRVPGSEMLVSTSHGFVMRPLPFGRQTVAAVHSNRVIIGTGDRFEVVAYEAGRGARLVMRAEDRHVPVTRATIRDFQRSSVTLGGEGDARLHTADAQMLADAPYPREMPPFTDLRIDADGNIWLQGPGSPSEPDARWTVFSPEGRVRGVVTLPGGLAVQEIGRDWLLGIAMDENQLQHVRLYRLEKDG